MRIEEWLLDSDPAIRWQVTEDARERARVAREGWGARLLAEQAPDGRWGDGVARPKWHSTLYTMLLLRSMGLDPRSEQARRAIALVKDKVKWGAEFGDASFFEGETEPCINGGVLALGSYFGEASDRLAERLLGEQLTDGGWNCDAPESARSSFHTTICVLEGLLEYDRAGGKLAVKEARRRGEECLLQRKLFRRLSTGEAIDPRWPRFAFPTTWHYDVLRGLEYLRTAEVSGDERVSEALEMVEQARQPEGWWLLRYPQPDPPRWWRPAIDFEMEEGEGKPSRWITLRARRVLHWFGK